MTSLTVIIVDDEPPALRMLRELLASEEATIHIMGEATNGAEAIAIINKVMPDVVFLDIQLQDMLGFEVLKQLNYQPFIIFTTAYDEYAVKAFDSLSVDYLLKPIKKERLLKAIDKLQYFTNGKVIPAMGPFVETLKQPESIQTLSVKKGNKFSLVQVADILYFEAYDKYSFVYMLNGEKLFCDYMLATLEEKLTSDFIRVQKSYIINRKKILEIHKYSTNRFAILLNNKDFTRIVTGPTYYQAVKEKFDL